MSITYDKSGLEGGTWTPVLSDGTNTATHSAQVGTYVKTGKMVHATARITTTSLTGSGTVSGAIRITGLPYTSASTVRVGSIGVGASVGLAITAGGSVTGYTVASSDYITLKLWDATTGTTDMQASEWTADGELSFDVIYYTA